MNLAFPFEIDGRGKTKEARRTDIRDEYICGLIEQILFTSPGERVMRPDFGSGVRELLFAGNSPELAATTQMLIQSALQQWLGQLIVVDSVEVSAVDSSLTIEVSYIVRRTQKASQVSFSRSLQG